MASKKRDAPMSSILRILFGYIIACLFAGIAIVMFVKTPAELLSLQTDDRIAFAVSAGTLVLAAATQSAYFATPFALIALLTANMLSIRSALFYVIIGAAISLLGLAALHAGEPAFSNTILNPYAITAYTVSGLVGGYVFWLLGVKKKPRTKPHASPKREPPENKNNKTKKPEKRLPAAYP